MLRDLTSIELFSNQEFYAFHPYMKEKYNVFQTENTAFSATASDMALGDGFDRHDPHSRAMVVKREAMRNATDGTFASLMCLFAVCSITEMSVISVYPQNGTILPRIFHENFVGKLVQEVELFIM